VSNEDAGLHPSGAHQNGLRPGEGRPRIQIYDPPMCCPIGLCGPTVDPVAYSGVIRPPDPARASH
jgi:hypothetical protein